MEKITAVKNDVIVVEHKMEEKTKTGIVLIESEFSESPTLRKCKVVAAGDTCEDVKEGDIVVVNPMFARKFSYMGEDYYKIKESEIEGILYVEDN